jgi:hypothetical protein
MRIRRTITGIAIVGGILAALGGFYAVWEFDDLFVGSVLMIVGIGLMASGTIYNMAMDDPEARLKALTTHRGETVDLRDPVEAPNAVGRDTSTRVSV